MKFFLHYYNYLLLASITTCNATIIPIAPTIGNNNELSCVDASSMFSTDEDMVVTLEAMLVLADANVESNSSILDSKISSSLDVSSKIEFSFTICVDMPLISCFSIFVAAEPCEVEP